MKKIPCLFERHHIDRDTGKLCEPDAPNSYYGATRDVPEECEWVMKGEGIPTVKWDGTAVLLKMNWQGQLRCYQRLASAHDQGPLAIEVQRWVSKTIWWVRATDPWIKEAFDNTLTLKTKPGEGTYEAIGPKINGNRYKAENHVLVRHGSQKEDLTHLDRSFDGIKAFLKDFKLKIPELYEEWCYHEGIVFHHSDGRMAKITRRDFGFESTTGKQTYPAFLKE